MITNWKVIEERILQAGSFRHVRDTVFELPDGRQETYTLSHATCNVVCVLPITEDGQVVLARQFRPGPGRVLDELPGGGVELGENHLTAVARELLEETGYQAGKIVSLGFPVDSGYSTLIREAFLATGCTKVAEPKLDKNEFIQPVTKAINDFLKQLIAGELTDHETAWLGLFKLGLIKAT